MKTLSALAALMIFSSTLSAQPKVLASGLKDPRAIIAGPDGRLYFSVAPRDDQGKNIMVLDNGKVKEFGRLPFVIVVGLTFDRDVLIGVGIAAGEQGVWTLDRNGQPRLLAATEPTAGSRALGSICFSNETNSAYVTAFGIMENTAYKGAIYKLGRAGRVETVLTSNEEPLLEYASKVIMEGDSHVLVVSLGNLLRIRLVDKAVERVFDQKHYATDICWEHFGRLICTNKSQRQICLVDFKNNTWITLAKDVGAIDDMCLDASGENLILVDRGAGTISSLSISSLTGVDAKPLPLETEVSFPKLRWSGWRAETDSGKLTPHRPVVLTHAGDETNRVFVGTQQGVVHVFPNDQEATKTQVFLDIQDRVRYNDDTNEEGFLGLAFHPRYKENGEFFVFYTPKKEKLVNVVSRFRVRKDNPNQADPASEEEIIRFKKPYWNHDGGTIIFGPDDKCLYITHGDGGLANDPHGNGQNLNTLLGKILRIDVDHKDPGKSYAIPKDNPFVDRKDARSEIWAYGLRNVWRMAFDTVSAKLWAADVGQELFEEINIIEKGGNYGWNRREGLHPFGPKGLGHNADMIDPIWEYDHTIGKSITGGVVYHGPRLSELSGHYIYGDYVSGKLWALFYDGHQGRVTANRPIKDPNLPVFSFGTDEQGEVYMLTSTTSGQGILRFKRTK